MALVGAAHYTHFLYEIPWENQHDFSFQVLHVALNKQTFSISFA